MRANYSSPPYPTQEKAAGRSLSCGDKTVGEMERSGLFFSVRQGPPAPATKWKLSPSSLPAEALASCILPQGTRAGRGADGGGQPAH